MVNSRIFQNAELVRRVPLHEMCHIGILGHGKQWQARMLKPAAPGEPWATVEVKDYQRSEAMRKRKGEGQEVIRGSPPNLGMGDRHTKVVRLNRQDP
jgi:hypothetical protein